MGFSGDGDTRGSWSRNIYKDKIKISVDDGVWHSDGHLQGIFRETSRLWSISSGCSCSSGPVEKEIQAKEPISECWWEEQMQLKLFSLTNQTKQELPIRKLIPAHLKTKTRAIDKENIKLIRGSCSHHFKWHCPPFYQMRPCFPRRIIKK